MLEVSEVKKDVTELKRYWEIRNTKFKEWFELLLMKDKLASSGMESYSSNEPQTFYDMAHYLLTKGELNHTTPIEAESAIELDRRARVHRGCQYMWTVIDRNRKYGGDQSFIDELSFYLLVLGWYSTVAAFDKETGELRTQIWNPMDVYPKYANNKLVSCVHSYKVPMKEAVLKAEDNNWNFKPQGSLVGDVTLDDYFYLDKDALFNNVLYNGASVTGNVPRPEMKLFVAPVGGFPDKGSLLSGSADWKKLAGRGIFEVNATVTNHFNKWKSMVAQILRDTAQPITQEFATTPQATPEQIRERGALFHYTPGEAGLQRLPPAAIPIELQGNLLELRREMQKGSFNDAVYGLVEGQSGYALSLLSSSSVNQILYSYMDAKHFVISENDKFWLSNLKTSKRVFEVKGKFIEKLSPKDIPDNVSIQVESDVATPKDWLERGTIANLLKEHLDESTIITEVLKFSDPQSIKRRKSIDRILEHPMSQQVELIAGYYAHADYLAERGDRRQAELFKRAAQALEAQMGAPAPGQGKPEEASRIEAERKAGAPGEKTRVTPNVAPPETTGGFSPQELRQSIGRGNVRAV